MVYSYENKLILIFRARHTHTHEYEMPRKGFLERVFMGIKFMDLIG